MVFSNAERRGIYLAEIEERERERTQTTVVRPLVRFRVYCAVLECSLYLASKREKGKILVSLVRLDCQDCVLRVYATHTKSYSLPVF